MKLKEFDTLEILSFKDTKSEFPSHFHDTFVFSFIEKGTFIENNIYGSSGKILISHPYEIHENKVFDNNSYTVTSMYINPEVIQFFTNQKEFCFPDKLIHGIVFLAK